MIWLKNVVVPRHACNYGRYDPVSTVKSLVNWSLDSYKYDGNRIKNSFWEFAMQDFHVINYRRNIKIKINKEFKRDPSSLDPNMSFSETV